MRVRRYFLRSSIVFLLILAPMRAHAAPPDFTRIYYFIDAAFERVSLLFVPDPELKAKRALEYAEEKVKTARSLDKNDKEKSLNFLLNSYEKYLNIARSQIRRSKDEVQLDNISKVLSDVNTNAGLALEDIYREAPENLKDEVRKSIEAANLINANLPLEVQGLRMKIITIKQKLEETKSRYREKKASNQADPYKNFNEQREKVRQTLFPTLGGE